jgi:hypothetical protein
MYKFILAFLLTSCTMEVTGDYVLSIDIECLGCFPMCSSADGTSTCVDSEGDTCSDCLVSCLGGARLECNMDFPACYNRLYDGDIEVPILCTKDMH